jgi:hypothetical protein
MIRRLEAFRSLMRLVYNHLRRRGHAVGCSASLLIGFGAAAIGFWAVRQAGL